MIDLVTGATTHRTGLLGYEHYGPGVSFRPLELTFYDDSSRALGVYAWHVNGPAYLGPPRVTGSRHVAQLSDSVWLTTGSHWSTTYAFNGSTVTYGDFFFDTPWAILIAPQARRATFTYNGSRSGALVLNTETGDSAYWIPGFHRVSGAAFSSDENRLYLVGDDDYPNTDTLVAVSSADGVRLAAAAIPAGFSPKALTADPDAPYLYLSGNRPDFTSGVRVDRLAVLVFHADDLALVGDLDPGAAASACVDTGWEGAIAVDRNRSTLHVVWVGSPVACQWSFDLVNP
jgi:hypothetical protein